MPIKSSFNQHWCFIVLLLFWLYIAISQSHATATTDMVQTLEYPQETNNYKLQIGQTGDVSTFSTSELQEKKIARRQAFRNRIVDFVFHYRCLRTGRRRRSFAAKAIFNSVTGRVYFRNVLHVDSFSNEDQEQVGLSTFYYVGRMKSTIYVPKDDFLCTITFGGYLEGEVEPDGMSLSFITDVDYFRFRPTVIEQCSFTCRPNNSRRRTCQIDEFPTACPRVVEASVRPP